jgi:hypothetical protein
LFKNDKIIFVNIESGVDKESDVGDLICFFLEVSLYGVQFLSNDTKTIFDMQDLDNPILNHIDATLKKAHIKISIVPTTDTCIDNYFCQIIPKNEAQNFSNQLGRKPPISFYSFLSYLFYYSENYQLKKDLANNKILFKNNDDKYYYIFFNGCFIDTNI